MIFFVKFHRFICIPLLVFSLSCCTGNIIRLSVNSSDDIQQILANAISSAGSSDSIDIRLGAGVFQSSSYPIVVKDVRANSITMTGNGPDSTILDCSNSNSRCLEIVDSDLDSATSCIIAITGIQFRNGKSVVQPTTTARGNVHYRALPVRRSTKMYPVIQVSTFVSLSQKGGFVIQRRTKVTQQQQRQQQPRASTTSSSITPSSLSPLDSSGGNILIRTSTKTVFFENVVSALGAASTFGAGIAIFDTTRPISLNNCKVVQNSIVSLSSSGSSTIIPSFGGGGIYCSNTSATISISNSVFSNNSVSASSLSSTISNKYLLAAGGGMGFYLCSSVSISNVNAERNVMYVSILPAATVSKSLFGGSMYFFGSANVTLVGPIVAGSSSMMSTVLGNGNIVGGSLYFESSTNIRIMGPVFANNSTLLLNNGTGNVWAGGMYFTNTYLVFMDGYISASNNILSTNSRVPALIGGGIYLVICSYITISGNMVLENNVLYTVGNGNLGAGGLYLYTISYLTCNGALSVFNNKLYTSGSGSLRGGGVYLYAGNYVSFQGGRIAISGNEQRVTSRTSNGYLRGGGFLIISSKNIYCGAAMTISRNIMASNGNGYLWGSLYIVGSNNVTLAGTIDINNNAVLSFFDYNLPYDTTPYVSPRGQPQCSSATITNTVGILDDGSFEQNYVPNLYCTWLLSPQQYIQYLKVFSITFTAFNVEKGYDFLYLYDGPTSFSPIIGQYSGAFSNYICGNGQCPALNSSIVSKSGMVFIVFTSDGGIQYDGFTLNWTMIDAGRTTGLSEYLLHNFETYATIAGGGGLAVYYSQIVATGLVITNNTVQSQGISVGGAVYFDSSYDNSRLSDCIFQGNVVRGFHSGGGGLAATKNSNVLCIRCQMRMNFAIASSKLCIFTAEEGVICPSVFGGHVLAAIGAKVTIQDSQLVQGLSICIVDGGMTCSAVGGAIAAIHPNTLLVVITSDCNTSAATSQQPSNRNYGGCLFSQDATVSLSRMKIFENRVFGIGTGGGLYCGASSLLFLTQSEFRGNAAKQGGAIGIGDESNADITESIFSANYGSSVGGAIFVKYDSSVALSNATFESNIASRASTIYTFNDNNDADYLLSDSFIRVPIGSSSIMLGRLNFSGLLWNCSQPGTVFVQDLTDEFFSLTCVACDPGTYAVESASTMFVDRKCQSCPFGGRCLGSSVESNGLFALTGFWGLLNADGSVNFQPCPGSYCCPLGRNCTYDHCEGGRVGRLCGRCAVGSGFRFFAEGCKKNDDCSDSVWFVWVIIAASVLAVLALLITTGLENSGMLSVMLYFYQVLPLIKSTTWKYTIPDAIVAVQSAFNFSPAGSSESSEGICLLKSMTTSQKLGSRMLLQGVIFSTIVLFFAVHFLLSKSGLIRWFTRRPPKPVHYFATLIRFCTIAYTTLVLVPLQMIQCVYVGHDYVWWWDATVVCYEGWQKAGFAAIALLVPLPFLLILLLWKKWRNEEELTADWQREIRRVLVGGYKQERRWWLGISLYRRLMMVLVFSTIMDGNWRAMASTALCVIFLVTNSVYKPFKIRMTRKCETTSLFVLAFLSIATAPQLSMLQFGTSEPIFNEVALEWIQFILAMAPVAGYVILCMYQISLFWTNFRTRSFGSSNSMETTTMTMIELEECVRCKMKQVEYPDGHYATDGCELHQYC